MNSTSPTTTTRTCYYAVGLVGCDSSSIHVYSNTYRNANYFKYVGDASAWEEFCENSGVNYCIKDTPDTSDAPNFSYEVFLLDREGTTVGGAWD